MNNISLISLGFSVFMFISAPVVISGDTGERVVSSYRIELDPDTNEPIKPNSANIQQNMRMSTKEINAMSTSHDGLRERVLPGGGYAVDLQGRFQGGSFATIDENGNVRISHQPINRIKK